VRDLHKVREQEGLSLSLSQVYVLLGLVAVALCLTFVLGFYLGRKAPPSIMEAEDPLVPADVQNDSVAILLARAAEEEGESGDKENIDLQFHDILPARTGEEGEAPRPSAAAPAAKPEVKDGAGAVTAGEEASRSDDSREAGDASGAGAQEGVKGQESAPLKEASKGELASKEGGAASGAPSRDGGQPSKEPSRGSDQASRGAGESSQSSRDGGQGGRGAGDPHPASKEGHKDGSSPQKESVAEATDRTKSKKADSREAARESEREAKSGGEAAKAKDGEKGSARSGHKDEVAARGEKPSVDRPAEKARGRVLAGGAGKAEPGRAAKEEPAAEKGAGKGYTVQVSSYQEAGVADKLVRQLSAQGFSAYKVAAEVNGHTWYRVRIGSYDSREGAEREMQRLKAARSELNPMIAHR
jgi:cell division protein FtsN